MEGGRRERRTGEEVVTETTFLWGGDIKFSSFEGSLSG
jgi:hypothetical protein